MADPGWYKDRSNPALARWFDGDVWTEHTLVIADQPEGVLPPPPPGWRPKEPEPEPWTPPAWEPPAYTPPPPAVAAEVEPEAVPEPEVAAEPAPEPEAEPEPEAAGEVEVELEPEPALEPEPEAAPEPAPEREVEPTPTLRLEGEPIVQSSSSTGDGAVREEAAEGPGGPDEQIGLLEPPPTVQPEPEPEPEPERGAEQPIPISHGDEEREDVGHGAVDAPGSEDRPEPGPASDLEVLGPQGVRDDDATVAATFDEPTFEAPPPGGLAALRRGLRRRRR